jgi:hypothetical protein
MGRPMDAAGDDDDRHDIKRGREMWVLCSEKNIRIIIPVAPNLPPDCELFQNQFSRGAGRGFERS